MAESGLSREPLRTAGAGEASRSLTRAPVEPSCGADEGIAQLYAAHWNRLVRLAWLLLRDQLAAEDVVQDAFVATHRKWASIRDGGRVVGYLQTSVVNGCRSVQRHNMVVNRHLTAEAAAADAPGRESPDSTEAQVLGAQDHQAMVKALGLLPTRQREVLVLRYYADLSEAQIATTLEISAGTVKAHAHRALRTLRASMPLPFDAMPAPARARVNPWPPESSQPPGVPKSPTAGPSVHHPDPEQS